MRQFHAVIFDLDGVICSTDEYHYLAWKKVADAIGAHFDRKIADRLRGVSRSASLEIILENYGGTLPREEKEELAARKNRIYRKMLETMSAEDLPAEVKETLDELRRRGYLLAIGSSSRNTAFILHQLGLEGYFDAVSDGNCITRSKPDPEVFLKAAEMLHVTADSCLVVEDAVSGAEAARRGGMAAACVGDAAGHGAGDYNLESITQLLEFLA